MSTTSDDEQRPRLDRTPMWTLDELCALVRTTPATVHTTLRDEHERYGKIAQLAAEYETLAATAQRDRWTRLLNNSGLTTDEVDRVVNAPAFGALTAELRRAEADGHAVEAVLPAMVGQRSLVDAEDPAAVLHHRLAHATARPRRSNGLMPRPTPPQWIAGLIPQATGPMAAEHEKALLERERQIGERADHLVARAQRDGEPWLTDLGPEPAHRRGRHSWQAVVQTIAAYRDRYAITSDALLGIESATSDVQAADAARAAAALHKATPPEPMLSAPWSDAHSPPVASGMML